MSEPESNNAEVNNKKKPLIYSVVFFILIGLIGLKQFAKQEMDKLSEELRSDEFRELLKDYENKLKEESLEQSGQSAKYLGSMDELLEGTAKAVNEQTPMMVDSATRLDNVAYLPPKTLYYKYTLLRADSTWSFSDAEIKEMKKISANYYKTTPDLAIFRDHGVIIEYVYYTEDGVMLTAYKVSPNDF